MRKAGDVLSSLFNEQFDSQLLKDARYYSGFFSAWSTLTGEIGLAAAAAHSRIADLDQGLLVIEVDHPGWKQILLTKQRQLLETVQHRFPDLHIRGISFWLGKDRFIPGTIEHPQNSPGGEAEDAGDSVGEDKPAEGDKTAANPIGDENFRQSLKQLERSFVKRNRRS